MRTSRAPHAGYPTERRRLGHSHCGRCGVSLPGPRELDVTAGWRPRHTCAYSDMTECPGCLRPIVRRVPDGRPLDMNLAPHRCPAVPEDDEEAARWRAAVERGYWAGAPARWAAHQDVVRCQIESQNAEDERLEAQRQAVADERDLEADLYADWVAFRTAYGIPDAGEAGLPEDRP